MNEFRAIKLDLLKQEMKYIKRLGAPSSCSAPLSLSEFRLVELERGGGGKDKVFYLHRFTMKSGRGGGVKDNDFSYIDLP